MTNNNFECISLLWDTEYFGIHSARVDLRGSVDESGQHKILQFCKNFEFVTISNFNNVMENNLWIGKKTTAFLTDINIQFVKEVGGKTGDNGARGGFPRSSEPLFLETAENKKWVDLNVFVKNSFPRNDQVIEVARNSFFYSRFFNDPWLPRAKARDIYVHWTECAFGQENKYFVVYEKDGYVAGFILFSITANKGVIELIAVDQRCQRQNVGSFLMRAMDSFAEKNALVEIKVGTQADNVSAISFFTKMGFHYLSYNSVYHLWQE